MDSITDRLKKREILTLSNSTSTLPDKIKTAIQKNRDADNLRRIIRGNYTLSQERKEKYGKLRALLAFDTTGSMGKYRAIIRKDLGYLINAFDEMLHSYELSLIGIGDHGDSKLFQIYHFMSNKDDLQLALDSIENTSGGGDGPEAFECLFREINKRFDLDKYTSLILLTDSIPHGMKGYKGQDNGCLYNVNYETELNRIKSRINGFYIISCPGNSLTSEKKALQRTMVDHDKYIMDLERIKNLPNLVLGMCMSDVRRLDHMMQYLKKV